MSDKHKWFPLFLRTRYKSHEDKAELPSLGRHMTAVRPYHEHSIRAIPNLCVFCIYNDNRRPIQLNQHYSYCHTSCSKRDSNNRSHIYARGDRYQTMLVQLLLSAPGPNCRIPCANQSSSIRFRKNWSFFCSSREHPRLRLLCSDRDLKRNIRGFRNTLSKEHRHKKRLIHYQDYPCMHRKKNTFFLLLYYSRLCCSN